MSVSKKLGETFMKGEDIKKATRLPDWFLRLKGKWDARKGPDVPNAYLRKLHNKISSLDNAEVNTAENILMPSRDSAAVALNKLSDSKRTVSSTPVPQSDGSPKSVRAQRRSNGTVSSARASAQSSANTLYSTNEFIISVNSILKVRIDETHKFGFKKCMAYVYGVKSKIPDYKPPEFAPETNAMDMYLSDHEILDTAIKEEAYRCIKSEKEEN